MNSRSGEWGEGHDMRVVWLAAFIMLQACVPRPVTPVRPREMTEVAATPYVRPPPQRSDGALPTMADEAIESAVERALAVTFGPAAVAIEVAVEDGFARLSGRVGSTVIRRVAEETAAAVQGVRQVVNRLALDASPRSDGLLAAAVSAALRADAATAGERIDVASHHRVIELGGRVRSDAVARRAEALAWAVGGVVGVSNRLEARVAHTEGRSDEAIAKVVRERISTIDDAPPPSPRIAVEGGRVTLAGETRSAGDRRDLIAAAWVSGVRAVDARALRVVWWDAPGDVQPRPAEPIEDDTIRRAVHAALAGDGRLAGKVPRLRVVRGTVYLAGAVPSRTAREAAEAVTENIAGVKAVRSSLRVVEASAPSDEQLRRRVQEALARDPYVDVQHIDVAVSAGRVTLDGIVDAPFEVARAEVVARGVAGVAAVANHVRNIDPPGPAVSETLRGNIEHALRWSPALAGARVDVGVEGRSVILRGTAPDPAARAAAEEIAREAGAQRVVNEIRIVKETRIVP